MPIGLVVPVSLWLGHRLRPHFLATAGPNVAERVPRGSDREPRADGDGLPAVPLKLRPPQ